MMPAKAGSRPQQIGAQRDDEKIQIIRHDCRWHCTSRGFMLQEARAGGRRAYPFQYGNSGSLVH